VPRHFQFLQRLEVLDQVGFFPAVQPESEVDVVVLDDVPQGCKAPVVEEAAFWCVHSPASGAVRTCGSASGRLERNRFHLSACAGCAPVPYTAATWQVAHLPSKTSLPALRSASKLPTGGLGALRRADRHEARKPGRDEIRGAARVPRAASRGHGILVAIAQALVEESPEPCISVTATQAFQ